MFRNFFRKTKFQSPLPSPNPNGSPWDPRTISAFLGRKDIPLIITHIENRIRFRSNPDEYQKNYETELIVSGSLDFIRDQFIHFTITFHREKSEYIGTIFSDYNMAFEYKGIPINLPMLDISLFDYDGKMENSILTAMRQNVISGKNFVEARFNINGFELEKDSTRFKTHIEDFYIWSEIHSPQLLPSQLDLGRLDISEVTGSLLREAPKN